MTARPHRALIPEALAGTRIDKAIPLLFTEISRGLARRLIDTGAVRLNGARCRTASRAVRAGEALEFAVDAGALAAARDAVPLRIVAQASGWVVVHKPPGQHVQGTAAGDEGTVLREVERWVRAQPPRAGHRGAWLVHRLDADASGAVLLATTSGAASALSEQLRERSVGRTYLALVGRPPETPSGSIDLRLLKDSSGRVRVDPAGQEASTVFEVLATYPRVGALLCLRLGTGRTHQIRAHLGAVGSPILGDRLYGGATAGRLCLHAWRLRFADPRTRREVRVECPPDAGFWSGVRSETQGRPPE
ncbi:MAG: pseudouridine synthase [Myxococcales bacterium]